MTIGPIPPISALPNATSPASTPPPAVGTGFADALANGLREVSDREHKADAAITDFAAGGSTQIHEVMIATAEASLATDMLVHVRDRALEAYHEIMRMQL